MNRLYAMMLVGLFGGLGCMARYAVGAVSTHLWGTRFAYGTLIVNLLGCFLIGLLFVSLAQKGAPSAQPVFIAAGIGFLGGFTTLSSFALDSNLLLEHGERRLMLIYMFSTVFGGLVLARLGMYVATAFR